MTPKARAVSVAAPVIMSRSTPTARMYEEGHL